MAKVATNLNPLIDAAREACADEAKAVEFWELVRFGDCPACPRCGDTDVYKMRGNGPTGRDVRWRSRCRGCGKQYTVKVGTVMEGSNIPLRHWALAYWLHASSKKGFAAKQLQRMTGLSYKSALFMAHRVRYSMSAEPSTPFEGTVEVDETYVGGKPRASEKKKGRIYKRGRGTSKIPVVAVVERGGRVVASPVVRITAENLHGAVKTYCSPTARVHSDELSLYKGLNKHFAGGHHTVSHSRDEYVRYEEDGTKTHTNTVEGFFSLLKRGIFGIHHSVSPRHLWRYVDEAAFKYSFRHVDDGVRLFTLMRAAEGKRLANRTRVCLTEGLWCMQAHGTH